METAEALWDGAESVVERLANGEDVELEGTGVLELEEGEWETEVPRGPGQVQFVLACSASEYRSSDVQPIMARLRSTDEAAFRILTGVKTDLLQLLPRYRLHGTVNTQRGELPIKMEDLTIDPRAPSPIEAGEPRARSKVGSVRRVFVGSSAELNNLLSLRMLIPNFAHHAEVCAGDIKITLSEVSPEAIRKLAIPESWGKVLPGSYLRVRRLRQSANESMGLAVESFGWLLSFFAGQRVHPIAWEGQGPNYNVWCVDDTHPSAPLSGDYMGSCLPPSSFAQFILLAWRAWRGHSEEQRGRLQGAINAYNDILSATYPTERVALTAMYLERFRGLMFGNSTILEALNADETKIDVGRAAKKIRAALRDFINSDVDLGDEEKDAVVEVVNRIGPGKVNGLFRKTFREALLELCKRTDLEVNPREIGKFIGERDRVMHGSWGSGAESTIQTFWLSQYGLNLLEKLMLRLFQYEGVYHNRVLGESDFFPAGVVKW